MIELNGTRSVADELDNFASHVLPDFVLANGFTVDTPLIALEIFLTDRGREGDPECDHMRGELFKYMDVFRVRASSSVKTLQRKMQSEAKFLYRHC